MGPEAAVNAVYANKIAAIADAGRAGRVRRRAARASTRRTSTSCGWPPTWSSTPIIEPDELRAELIRRYAVLVGRSRHLATKRHGIPPT